MYIYIYIYIYIYVILTLKYIYICVFVCVRAYAYIQKYKCSSYYVHQTTILLRIPAREGAPKGATAAVAVAAAAVSASRKIRPTTMVATAVNGTNTRRTCIMP